MYSLKRLGVLSCLLFVASAAMAAPVSTNVSACVNSTTGAVRIVASTSLCVAGEIGMSWALVGLPARKALPERKALPDLAARKDRKAQPDPPAQWGRLDPPAQLVRLAHKAPPELQVRQEPLAPKDPKAHKARKAQPVRLAQPEPQAPRDRKACWAILALRDRKARPARMRRSRPISPSSPVCSAPLPTQTEMGTRGAARPPSCMTPTSARSATLFFP